MAEIKMCQIKSTKTGELMPIDCAAWKSKYQYMTDNKGNPIFEYAGQANVWVEDEAKEPANTKTASITTTQNRKKGCGCRR